MRKRESEISMGNKERRRNEKMERKRGVPFQQALERERADKLSIMTR